MTSNRKRSSTPHPSAQRLERIRGALLKWYDAEGRNFFWRAPRLSAFSILVAEILLTKTRAELAEPIAVSLLSVYKTPADLANADRDDLERQLYPLGLHRKRARNLVACAETLIRDFEGTVPQSIEELMTLPNVGRYAAHAVASVAFDQVVPILDANVARILRRVLTLGPPPPRLSSAHDLWTLAERLLHKQHPKVFNWAVLDLGGTICLPRDPECFRCPIARYCDLGKGVRSKRATGESISTVGIRRKHSLPVNG